MSSTSNQQRTLLQNRKMWPMLQDIAEQLPWRVNGEPTFLDKSDWKDILTASLVKEVRLADAADGNGFVMLGYSTRQFCKSGESDPRSNRFSMTDFIELVYAFGTNHGVVWTDPAVDALFNYPEARSAA